MNTLKLCIVFVTIYYVSQLVYSPDLIISRSDSIQLLRLRHTTHGNVETSSGGQKFEQETLQRNTRDDETQFFVVRIFIHYNICIFV